MIKYQLVLLFFFTQFLTAQTADVAKAPNSYIYDIDLAKAKGYGGLEIPVAKAYKMWSGYEYLKNGDVATPIPAGVQTASLYWEDVPGLVREVSVSSHGEPSASKIRVNIDAGRGKGNAVVAFKVNGKIYWSWHIWVTDNPEKGVVYGQGFETDANNNPITVQYMDRNLGAASSSFLNDEWQKSGGLMYQWGRKDPFPPLVYKDTYFYEISGEVGTLKHPVIDATNTIPVQKRPHDDIGLNMQYAVANPLTFVINTDGGNWFSAARYKANGDGPAYKTWDLWSDNGRGGNTNANSSDPNLQRDSRSYELKSELDPCPSGWRVPSYYGRETQNNNLAFFGRKGSGANDDLSVENRRLSPDAVNPMLDGVRVYPGLGLDFTNAQNGARNIGVLPVSGSYVYYPNSNAPDAPVGMMFQDNQANGGLWSATFGYDGARLFTLISDPHRTTTSVGLHEIYNNETNPSRTGNAVRCMRDPNMAAIGNFATEYFAGQNESYTAGLDNPNAYIVKPGETVLIPVNKAFSAYNQLLSDGEMLPSNRLTAKVLWSTNADLVESVAINSDANDARNSVIQVKAKAGQQGNAVISLHNGDVTNPAYWSWHIWVTNAEPETHTVTYTTEKKITTNGNFVNATKSGMPALTTVFMDRNLGALSNDLESGVAGGLHYQWGRKDPLPSFAGRDAVFVSNKSQTQNSGAAQFEKMTPADYAAHFTADYTSYRSTNASAATRLKENIRYATQNPLVFMYQKGTGMLYDGGSHYDNNLSQVRDWAAEERAKAPERWGHGGEKSPFDPCPEGWRVPDVSFTNLYSSSKGNSPWYNGYQNDAYGRAGVIQDQWHDVGSFYGGSAVVSKGWKFPGVNFNLGDFPADGIRGELGENEITYARSGVWTASMADYNTGFALAMQFQGNKMQTGAGAYPQAAMSVRCAKDETRLLGLPRPKKEPVVPPAPVVPPTTAPTPGPAPAALRLYPNPFTDSFAVDDPAAKSVQIFGVSGKLFLQRTLKEGRADVSALLPGLYLVKITLGDGTTVTKKVIKR